MDSSSREDLSALMDGELAPEPTRFLLRRLDHDPELGATWSRWHLIRACLASDSARMTAACRDDDFAARIASALTAEEVPEAHRRHWLRYVGGSAIAAGVAVAALMLNVPNPRVGTTAPVAESSPAAIAAAPTGLADAAPTGNHAVPWLLSRQPTALSAQPASANVVYGTGLMQPDYLRRAGYARDAAFTLAPVYQGVGAGPELPPRSARAAAGSGGLH